jgi:hypothetical protein
MPTPTKLAPNGAHSAPGVGARRPQACLAYRFPQVRELPLRLEPVVPDTFGGLVLERNAPPLRTVLPTTTHVRRTHS